MGGFGITPKPSAIDWGIVVVTSPLLFLAGIAYGMHLILVSMWEFEGKAFDRVYDAWVRVRGR